MMKFLTIVAEDLFKKFGKELPEIAVIFPNNRARLFFNSELFKIAGQAVWSPSFLTIDDIFSSQTELSVAPPVTLSTYLYNSYSKAFKKKYPDKKCESYDEFYLWGEILLSDFDDIDKNLADASGLFTNIKEQAEYSDTLDYLTEEQTEKIKRFFSNFNPAKKTELKQRFIENWNILTDVYTDFKRQLKEKKLAGKGMLQREVIETIKNEGFILDNYKKFVFVGFNVLNKCEYSLFKKIYDSGQALFYWDYDKFYLESSNREAGKFIRKDLENFPNELDKSFFENFSKGKNINFISASTEDAQARFIPEWIKGLQKNNEFKTEETAIILCNENLLIPVLHSIPESIDYLNVTMGFPLIQTPAAGLIENICSMQLTKRGESFYYKNILSVINNPLIQEISKSWEEEQQTKVIAEKIIKGHIFYPGKDVICNGEEILDYIFTPAEIPEDFINGLLSILNLLSKSFYADADIIENDTEDPDTVTDADPLRDESIFRCYTLILSLKDQIKEGNISMNMPTIVSLIRKIIRTSNVPFSGEPVKGLQIMGMLETRNLDFKNVLMLSVNEGMIPKKTFDNSFIPYNLKKAFNLTTFEHEDSIYSFYFYRILQRAENISLVYNTSTEGLSTGEMSRFMLQLLVESSHKINNFNIQPEIILPDIKEITVTKDEKILSILNEKFNINRHTGERKKIFSPTSLNCYMDCSLKFYFKYIVGIYEDEDDITDEIDNRIIGTIFHNSAQFIYYDILMRKSGLNPQIADTENGSITYKFNKDLENGSLNNIVEISDLNEWTGEKAIRSVKAVAEYFILKEFLNAKPEKDGKSLNLTKINTETRKTRKIKYNGEQLVKLDVITRFIKRMLEIDKKRAPFKIYGLEKPIEEEITIDTSLKIKTGGIIDRLDKKDNTYRILDYKTGGKPSSINNVNALFTPGKDRSGYIFQTFLYSSIIKNKHYISPEDKICPEILYIHKAKDENYDSSITIGKGLKSGRIEDIAPLKDDFINNLKKVLSDIFNPDIPFKQPSFNDKCSYCTFKKICKK